MRLPLSVGLDAPPSSHDRLSRWRSRWPTRRLVAAVLLAVPLGWVLADAGGGWSPTTFPAWTALVVVAALVGAATLSTYVPARGAPWRLDLGCAPCSAVSGLTVLAAAWLLALGPHQASMALVAVIVATAGLLQRLTPDSTTCATGPR
ncbi:hypothetical protein [Sanguibacter antarcticus]|uniref:Uncharacterized protein n=1 Tax=Sanguibacter antarcticus TaxID=372484 RepID=A0A2A9E9B6_9MICO|nr:hypothetical protein [Sanguibacter antarcticus]PFG34829.1 hypothetical protein ATL42_2756 [Sanguibacter antarcticus]